MNMSTALSGVAFGSITGASLILAEVVITGGTHVPIEMAVTVGVFSCGVVWYLGRKFQSLEDKIQTVADDLAKRPCQLMGGKCEPMKRKEKDD